MTVQTQSGSQILTNFATAVQGAAKALVDFSVGSILRAIGQGAMGIALWLQGMALQVASLTRFATSNESDADSWANDFGFKRLPSKPSSGPVTLARFTPTNAASVQAATNSGTDSSGNTIWAGGAIVQTLDGSEQFMVIPDTTQSAYSASTNTYVLSAGIGSITATVVSTTAGAAGNVAAGAISVLGSAIVGVDTVTNALAFTNGADAETDTAFRARFVTYLGSLSDGTPAAIATAVENLQQDAICELVENLTYGGAASPGYFYAVVDDGSGSPPSSFLSSASNAIEATRPIATTYGVFDPVIVNVAVVLTITAATGYTHAALVPIVQAAIQSYINKLIEGKTLPWSRIPELAWDASPGVASVTSWTLNGGTADIVPSGVQQVIKCSGVTVN